MLKNHRIRFHWFLILLFLFTLAPQTAGQNTRSRPDNFKVRQEHDRRNDTTTVRIGPMTIMGSFRQTPELRLSAFYIYTGMQPTKPDMITLVIETATKTKGSWDSHPKSHLHFIIDGKYINLGAIKLIDSRLGKSFIATDLFLEQLTTEVSNEVFSELVKKIASAKQAQLYIGGYRSRLEKWHVKALANLEKEANR